MRWTLPPSRVGVLAVTVLALSSISAAAQEPRRTRPQLPPATDVDTALTDTLARLERRLAKAAIGGFRDTLEMARLVGAAFTLRVADAPERSLPRALWGQPNDAYKIESLDEQLHTARRVTDDVAVVSFLLTQKASREGSDRSGAFYVVDVWNRRGGNWQLIARYSSPQGRTFDRSAVRPPDT